MTSPKKRGPGRPPKADAEKMVQFNCRISQSTLAYLTRIGKGNAYAAGQAILEAAAKGGNAK